MRCAACGEEKESLEHVVLECKAIQPHQPSVTTLERALGFGFSKPPGNGPQASEANGGGDEQRWTLIHRQRPLSGRSVVSKTVHSYKDACGENPFAELARFAMSMLVLP
ncbi:hypothetical protein HPB48_011567 [Haemaphysalis longicornis]|uniref:Uncharacterized protein n=1 Tax=Haemaphysalis longicornis TaxID=44386 RepID=A0A9J6FZS9_HAELO|nr:hypothetical protein HPB48_011567 [Haemaphysalis longicornis]